MAFSKNTTKRILSAQDQIASNTYTITKAKGPTFHGNKKKK